jgi:predicted MFS family arabinose efflux permease
LDRTCRRNLFGISSVELLWGLGLPVVMESTFLQLFLRHLGASSFLIGLIPTLISAGVALFSLFSYFLTAHLERKRTAMVLVHVSAAIPVLAFGVTLVFTGIRASTLTVFLAAYALFSIGAGLMIPVWQNYLVKIFPEQRAIPAMAVMMIAQSAGRLAGSLFLVRIVERYSFSARGASLVFFTVGLLFLIGSFPFLFTVEEAGPPASSPSRNIVRRLSAVLRNRNFLLFLGTDLEYFALTGVISFYANYATEFCGINPALASGLFVAFIYLGSVLANALLGWANLFSMRDKYLLTKSLALFGTLLLAFHSAPWVFYLASLLMGASRGTRSMVFAPAVKRLSGVPDATLYFAVAPILILPFSTALPLVDGAFLDRFAHLGSCSYRILFLAMGALSLGGMAFALRVPWSGPPAGEQA